jgi:hypothetical protein
MASKLLAPIDDPRKVYIRTRSGEIIVGRSVRRKPEKPVVYFVQAENGLIKIGSTKRMADRLQSLCNGSPIALILLATVKGDRTFEFALHIKFAAHRQHGEWFLPHPDILAEIERLKPRR